jgi:hypothetical protein
MASFDSLRKRNSALERKAALLGKLRSKPPGESAPPSGETLAPLPSTPVSQGTAAPIIEAPLVAMPRPAARLPFSLYSDDVNGPVKVDPAIEALASELRAVARYGDVRVALLWPGSLKALALAHAVATMSCWQEGDKRGIRTLLYPAKSNFVQSLNHLTLERREVGALGSELYEDLSGSKNLRVTVSCRDKDLLLLTLNSVREEGAPVNPTVAELLPHFYSDLQFKSWAPCDGKLLRNLSKRLASRQHAKAVRDGNLSPLEDPKSAPDALFALGWRTAHSDFKPALRRLKADGAPNVILIDATRAVRFSQLTWKADVMAFLDAVHEVWTERPPGICIVTDEPVVRHQLQQEVEKRSKKSSAAVARLKDSGLPTFGIPCSSRGNGLASSKSADVASVAMRKVTLDLTDSEASELISQLHSLRGNAEREEWKEPLAAAAKFLTQLSSLPASIDVLKDWLTRADVPIAVHEKYSWSTHGAKLNGLVRDPEYRDKDKLKRAIEKGDRLWLNYSKGTPFARQLAALVERHTRGKERCVVAFTRPTARTLAERYFETSDVYPDGAGYEVLKDSVRFVLSSRLETELGTRGTETLILAGLNEETLRLLILDNRVSSPTFVLLTRRNAAYLHETLKAIKGLPEFAPLMSRIGPLLAQLDAMPKLQERFQFSKEDFVLPTFSFEQGLSAAALVDEQENDPNALVLHLEGRMVVKRSPSARVHVYDPALAHVDTRGFESKTARSLEAGDRLFIMSGELREMTEHALREAGIPIDSDKRFEVELRRYHGRVLEGIRSFNEASLTDVARRIHAKVMEEAAKPLNFPVVETVRSWLNAERDLESSFSETTAHAPQQEHVFRAFTKALGFLDIEGTYYWKRVIQPLRGTRRYDGRRVSEAYADLLLEPEAAVVHKQMPPEVVSVLFERARENVYVIDRIEHPNRMVEL